MRDPHVSRLLRTVLSFLTSICLIHLPVLPSSLAAPAFVFTRLSRSFPRARDLHVSSRSCSNNVCDKKFRNGRGLNSQPLEWQFSMLTARPRHSPLGPGLLTCYKFTSRACQLNLPYYYEVKNLNIRSVLLQRFFFLSFISPTC